MSIMNRVFRKTAWLREALVIYLTYHPICRCILFVFRSTAFHKLLSTRSLYSLRLLYFSSDTHQKGMSMTVVHSAVSIPQELAHSHTYCLQTCRRCFLFIIQGRNIMEQNGEAERDSKVLGYYGGKTKMVFIFSPMLQSVTFWRPWIFYADTKEMPWRVGKS